VCDIDNDGDKEILTTVFSGNSLTRKIIVVHHDGTIDAGWNSKNPTIDYSDNWHTQDISVGDLNNNGNLEVVALGQNVVKVWDNLGNLTSSTIINGLSPGKLTPILADVDNEPDLEIIFGATSSDGKGLVYALKMNGSKALGFPLQTDDPLIGSPCVADIDNNGTNELIAASGNKIYVWETAGSAASIEWGSERHNCRNTGEYTSSTCPDLIINSYTTWATDKISCGNIIVENGGTLTITATTYMSKYTITIKNGGKLIVSGGTIDDANIIVQNGGELTIINNGKLILRGFDNLEIELGGVFNMDEGEILLK
jgi:hypothetical protein